MLDYIYTREEGIQLLILPSPIYSHGDYIPIQEPFDMLLEDMELGQDLRFIL
jgi:hypothetical protein